MQTKDVSNSSKTGGALKRQDSSKTLQSPKAAGTPKRQDSSKSLQSPKSAGTPKSLQSPNLDGAPEQHDSATSSKTGNLCRLKSSANLGQMVACKAKVKKQKKIAKQTPAEAEDGDIEEPAPPAKKRSRKTAEDIKNMSFQDRKKLLCSRAYHITRDEAVRTGVDDDKAKKLARAASQKVAEQLSKEMDAAAQAAGDDKQPGE